MLTPADLAGPANPLAAHYTRFRVGERLLLTGHSHQAWPDAAFDGQVEAFEDAARLVDDKWERAEAMAWRVRRGVAQRLGESDPSRIALGASTHDLVIRLLSALPLGERPRLLTTDAEFHTLRRQLDRLAETRLEVVKVHGAPSDSIAERLIAALNERTAAVFVSSVLFANAHRVPDLGSLLAACRRLGAELVVDAYHHLNVVPFSLEREHLEDAFVIGGGYKYLQLGEGNCFMRVPPGREHLRPVVTGWFSEFALLSERAGAGVPYGDRAARWAGATYDPVSHYRAARVLDFFEEQELTPERLRALSQHQVGLLSGHFDALQLDPAVLTRDRSVPLERLGGFLALTGPRAGEWCRRLHQRSVMTDARGDVLRFGPAPYLADAQLTAAMDALGEAVRAG